MNNTSQTLGNRAIGLAIELYNSKNDPDLTTILAQMEMLWFLYILKTQKK